jgi:uncharacterized protein DUF4236
MRGAAPAGVRMSWSYRKSINLGPFRINASKSGLGYSIGGRGFRTGVRPNGRQYSRVTIPGTGLSYTTTPKAGGCAIWGALLPASWWAVHLLTHA